MKKKETLEEAAERLTQDYNGNISQKLIAKTFITVGAKWQQEQDKNRYSEEEVKDIMAETWIRCVGNDGNDFKELRDKILELFKNKIMTLKEKGL